MIYALQPKSSTVNSITVWAPEWLNTFKETAAAITDISIKTDQIDVVSSQNYTDFINNLI